MTNMSTTAKQQNEAAAQIEEIEANYLQICCELNMDKETEKAAWQSYVDVSQSSTLQGDPNHWLCCAVYAACRETFTPTVGNSNALVAGNCVSLTKLLRSCNISINDFCHKIKVWANIRNTSKGIRAQIDRLEQSFHVSLCVYQKYEEIFAKLFLISSPERKKKKAKPGPCSPGKLFEFGWCLFIAAKGEEPNRRTDLVLSLHLLLCCIDFIFVNCVLADRRDIIKADFAGLPKEWNSDDFDVTSLKNFCVIRELCELVSADVVDVINLKQTEWKTILTKFIKHKTLLCSSPSDTISNAYFEPNLKSLNNTYEQYILSVGEFDERIFLNSEKDKSFQMNSESRCIPGTPVSSAVAIQNLKTIASRNISGDFKAFIGDQHYTALETRLNELRLLFEQACPNDDNNPILTDGIFKMARALYYSFLEKLVVHESRIKSQFDFTVILKHNMLQCALFVCGMEIVIFINNVQVGNDRLEFPWVLECFKLNPYYFYRIIESVVQNHDSFLNRETISHLNTIEVMCLDHLCWEDKSLLWEAIKISDGKLPPYADVDHRNRSTNESSARKDESKLQRSFFQSPSIGFQLPKTTETAETARRNLFNAGPSRESINETPKQTPPKPRAGSLSLFLRKFYETASGRISKVCEALSIREHTDSIWTIFEHCIRNQTEIMRNRHLDQIIMCSIYVLIKVKNLPNINFSCIMTICRQVLKMPSSTYRSVLLSTVEGKPVYGDIIKFYNETYVQAVSPFALTFAENHGERHLLSPRPQERLQSPHQLPNSQFFLQCLEKDTVPLSPNVIVFEINKSPAKDLKMINDRVRGKRTIAFASEDPNNTIDKRFKHSLKLLEVINDRKQNPKK